MKIAQVAPLFESVPPQCYGGTERVVSFLTEELVRQGHDVTLFASGDSQTKAKLVVSHALKNTTPSERAFQASIDELYGLGFDYDKSYADRIGKVTADDVVNVVKKYFEHGLTVTSSPAVK